MRGLIRSVHHVNFVVRDLERAVAQYERALGVTVSHRDSLAGRGELARFKVGDTWIVLVCPSDPDSVPGRHLAEHGEGFFLISYAVDDLDDAARALSSLGVGITTPQPRKGLDDWWVIDLDPADTAGAQVQLVAVDAERPDS